MLPDSKPSGGVVAAAAVAMIGSVLVIGFGILVEVSLRINPGRTGRGMPPESAATARASASLVWLVIILVACFGLLVGVELLQRKNWARVAMLVWSSIMVFFSLLVMVATFAVMRSMPTPPNVPEAMWRSMTLYLPLIYAVPLGIGVWWLAFFAQGSIAAQFAPQAIAPWPQNTADGASGGPPAITGRAAKLSCPLPLAIVAGYMIFSGASTLPFLFWVARYPQLLMGHTISGSPAKLYLGIIALTHLAAGIGVFRFRRWAYYVGAAIYGFAVLNTLICLITPNIEDAMREAMSRVNLPANQPMLFDPVKNVYLFFLLGGMFSAALLTIFLSYRTKFLDAVERRGQSA